MADRPCIAVVSPFLDKRHGTERCVAEQVERLARQHGYEVHLYCQRVEDIEGLDQLRTGDLLPGLPGAGESKSASRAQMSGRILWHRISDVPGPHLVKYVWWFLANQFRRWRDQRLRGLQFDLVYSPGINCWDADAVGVHMVFHEYFRVIRDELRLRRNPLRAWPRVLHRRLYYRLIMALEKRIYPSPRVTLAAVSRVTAEEIRRYFGREDVYVIPNAVNVQSFHPSVREARRPEVRKRMRFDGGQFVLLLVGNDWKNKGLTCLLEAVARCSDLPVHVLVVGRDDRAPYQPTIQQLGLEGRVSFSEPSADVMQFYAAADAYVAPSLRDAFNLAVAEAMACGLPVIVSERAGVSELIHDGVDGLTLRDPRDASELARLVRLLYENSDMRLRVAQNAARLALQLSWERNAEQTRTFLECGRKRKNK